jgi:hypothetical protein
MRCVSIRQAVSGDMPESPAWASLWYFSLSQAEKKALSSSSVLGFCKEHSAGKESTVRLNRSIFPLLCISLHNKGYDKKSVM